MLTQQPKPKQSNYCEITVEIWGKCLKKAYLKAGGVNPVISPSHSVLPWLSASCSLVL